MVSFYRPCEARRNPRALTAVATQQRCLMNLDNDRHPRLAFLEDFQAELQTWIDMGDALVVCGDINDDILGPTVTNFFDGLGLRHLIFSKHDSATAPATYYHNHNDKSVDGIWASPCLDLVQGGYLSKYEIPGDHLPIWFDMVNL
jgi:hypothetical protein